MNRQAMKTLVLTLALVLVEPALLLAPARGDTPGKTLSLADQQITQDHGGKPVRVDPTTLADAQVLKYQASTGTWVAGSSSGPTTSPLATVLVNGNQTGGTDIVPTGGTGIYSNATSTYFQNSAHDGIFITSGSVETRVGNVQMIGVGSSSIDIGTTLTLGPHTLALASATVSGTPTWSSSQNITLSQAAQGNVTSLGTLTGLTMGGQVSFATGAGAITQILGPTDQNLAIAGASAGATSTGRSLTLTSGPGGATSGNSGSVTIQSGAVVSGNSGSILISTPNAAGASSGAGQIQISVGTSGSSVSGSNVNISAGAAGGSAGQALLTGGAGASGVNAGPVTCTGGAGVTSSAGGSGDFGGGNGAGTNKAAGGATLNTGLPTGTASADIAMTSGFVLASGSTVQTAYDRQRITSKTRTLSTTTATNTVFAVLSNAVTDSGVGCTVTGTIELIDGAHHVGTIHFTVEFSSVNQNGVVTAGVVPVLGTSNGSITTGGTYTTLTTTFTAAVSSTNLQIGVTPTWAAGTPTTVRMTYQVMVNGQGSITPQ